MKQSTAISLSVMMFFQYFIWSAWYVTMGTYMEASLGATGKDIGQAFSALALATMISPFFVGMIADRFFAAQKIMGVLHLLGAILLVLATKVGNSQFFYWIILAYSLVYMPTVALSNSVAFAQMTDPGKQFPWIRVFGTLGWIVAGLLVGSWEIEKTPETFYLAAGVSVALGLLSFALPNTPPKGREQGESTALFSKESLSIFKDRSYSVFFIAAILVCIPLAFYYGFANPFLNEIGMDKPAQKMILGQFSEGLFILAIPFLFNRIGVKNILLIGILAWILRYVLFAYGYGEPNGWMIYLGIILHGVCYDFFFVTGYMYSEKKAGPQNKNAAQGLFTFATYGLGMVIGTWFSGLVADRYVVGEGHDWQSIWLIPAAIAAAVLLYFIFFFRDRKTAGQP
ncbi:nucleoside permease [Flavihumibacter sp. UBA7668]|uniref:nucleoside permease n=1 Tax=Flavihumibacter sp. UBA7668 TaxID=1946542 RepID=UPI0025BA1347|nr:nucleoside permease [Flavihumibacter sp. UBA7668]